MQMATEDIGYDRLEKLKQKCNAVILAHNYQPAGIQDIADYVGDSLGLAIKASETDADTIVFCGVDFMAETAKVISPDRMVLIPEPESRCPLASMVTAEKLVELRKQHPGVPVVSYVNTPASVKAESDICCTSSNMMEVIGSLDSDEIIFTPDKHMAAYIQSKTPKKIIPWKGFCPTHVRILPEHVIKQKKMHPHAEVLVHPECRLDVAQLGDTVTSTGGMITHAKSSAADEFIIATEIGLIHRLSREIPGKRFYPASENAVCPNMKKNSIAKVILALEKTQHEVKVPPKVMDGAKKAIERMLSL